MEIKNAEMMALELMRKHGLYEAKWSLDFDNSVSRLGYCSYKLKKISLSRHATMVNSQEEVLNTILHEIAHALVGPGYHHGPIWKAKAREIGCNAERTGKIEVQAPAKYKVTCTSCSRVYNFYRRPKWFNRIEQVWCNHCGKTASMGKFKVDMADGVGISFVGKKTLDKVTII